MNIPPRNSSNDVIRKWCEEIIEIISKSPTQKSFIQPDEYPQFPRNRKKILMYLFLLHQDILIWPWNELSAISENSLEIDYVEILNFFEEDDKKIILDAQTMLGFSRKDGEFLSKLLFFIIDAIHTVFPEEKDNLIDFEIHNDGFIVNSQI